MTLTTTTRTETENLLFSEETDNQIIIPVNATIRIFNFVTRDDLENCKLVCKTWKNSIIYADKQLPKRPVDTMILSTNREYAVSFCHDNVKKNFYYRKYFVDRDIDEIEIKKTQKLDGNFEEQGFRFPCGYRYPRISDTFKFKPMDPIHHNACKNVRSVIYRPGRAYTKKLFTPPLRLYERIKQMLDKCNVHRLVFHAFTFTDLFVEKLFEYAREPLSGLNTVIIHGCSFRYISPAALHKLLNELRAEEYFIENTRYCLSTHFGPTLLEIPSIQRAKIVCFGNAIERHTGNPLIFPIDDEIFLEFIRKIIRHGNTGIRRKFFGIALCRATQKIIERYEKIPYQTTFISRNRTVAQYNNADQELLRQCLYKHVLLGEFRCKL